MWIEFDPAVSSGRPECVFAKSTCSETGKMRLASFKETATSRGSRRGQGWCTPHTIRRFGEKLLAQQLWCLGQDIEHPQGNLLMQYGFSRHRDRDLNFRSTCYRLDQGQLHVALWGFGVFFGRRDLGGLFLGRFGFCPVWAPIEAIALSVHWPDELPAFGRPHGSGQWRRAKLLWATLLQWISEYERWTTVAAGLQYRQKCVESWLRPFVKAERMADAWRFVAMRSWEKRNQSIGRQLKKFTFQ